MGGDKNAGLRDAWQTSVPNQANHDARCGAVKEGLRSVASAGACDCSYPRSCISTPKLRL